MNSVATIYTIVKHTPVICWENILECGFFQTESTVWIPIMARDGT
jgi:hypothetical protein